VSRFGVQAVITTDCGTQFTSFLCAALCTLLNIQHSQTTAYHPQSNGIVKRFRRPLKDTLPASCAAASWVDHLPGGLLGLCAAAREDYSTTPAQAVFSSPLILPGQFWIHLIYLQEISWNKTPPPPANSRHSYPITSTHQRCL
jgi:transposase InsO family protein